MKRKLFFTLLWAADLIFNISVRIDPTNPKIDHLPGSKRPSQRYISEEKGQPESVESITFFTCRDGCLRNQLLRNQLTEIFRK